MNSPMKIARRLAMKTRRFLQSLVLSYTKKVQCNICGWEGHHFLSDSWHERIKCPRCGSDIRHRLFFAALQNIENLSFDRLIYNKVILHFAPEDNISPIIRKKSAYYVTADYLQQRYDLKLDISDMLEIKDESFDIIIAFDVLEHVLDYHKALEEIHRVLSSKGFGILTVPQKDNLLVTYEDPSIVTPDGRKEHFGQSDHLRIFGDDFSRTVMNKGFSVTAVDDSMFPDDMKRKNVLFPPVGSKHPLATNHRKVFFCQKT